FPTRGSSDLSFTSISTRYFPTGQPLVGLLKLKSPASVSPSTSSIVSRTFVFAGATSPTSSAINTPRILSPSFAPLVLNMAYTCGASAANVVVSFPFGLVVIVALTTTFEVLLVATRGGNVVVGIFGLIERS